MPITNDSYVDQYRQIHQSKRYGVSGYKFVDHLQLCLAELRPGTVLDYGCGQTDLSDTIDFGAASFHRYDPAISAIDTLPVEHADLVINTDVMEHIPEADVPEVISHLSSLTSNAFFSIATNHAQEILPDGSNAHCSVKTPEEWLELIRQYFPDTCQISTKRKNTFLAVTWNSRLLEQLRKIDDLYFLRRRLRKWRLLGLFERT